VHGFSCRQRDHIEKLQVLPRNHIKSCGDTPITPLKFTCCQTTWLASYLPAFIWYGLCAKSSGTVVKAGMLTTMLHGGFQLLLARVMCCHSRELILLSKHSRVPSLLLPVPKHLPHLNSNGFPSSWYGILAPIVASIKSRATQKHCCF
jgi:hypothetical protein